MRKRNKKYAKKDLKSFRQRGCFVVVKKRKVMHLSLEKGRKEQMEMNYQYLFWK